MSLSDKIVEGEFHVLAGYIHSTHVREAVRELKADIRKHWGHCDCDCGEMKSFLDHLDEKFIDKTFGEKLI